MLYGSETAILLDCPHRTEQGYVRLVAASGRHDAVDFVGL